MFDCTLIKNLNFSLFALSISGILLHIFILVDFINYCFFVVSNFIELIGHRIEGCILHSVNDLLLLSFRLEKTFLYARRFIQ